MIRIRLLAVFGVIVACFLLTPRPPREEPAAIPTAEPEPPPFAFIARFGGTRLRHPSPANHLYFSADGRRMLSLGLGDAQTWDMPDGRLRPAVKSSQFRVLSLVGLRVGGRHPINGHDRMLMDDAENGKETKVLAGLSGPGRVWMWDTATSNFTTEVLPGDQAGRTIPAPQGTEYTLASPDGRWLAASGAETLRIRDTTVNTDWVTLESYIDRRAGCGRFDAPTCLIPVQFSSDGRFLLTQWSGYGRGLELWNIVGQPFRVSELPYVYLRPWPSHAAAFSRDGRRWAAVVAETDGNGYGNDHIRVWETASGNEVFRFDPRNASGCAFTPDGKRMVVAHTDTTFSVWDYSVLESRGVRSDAKTEAWDRLADRDAKIGLGAVESLVADPNAVAYLKERFRPADTAKLIAELDDNDFATREAASKELAALGERAETALREAQAKSPSAEVRSRAGRLFGTLTERHSTARLRASRAVEVLERVGTPAARDLLMQCATDTTHLASEAKLALGRLATVR